MLSYEDCVGLSELTAEEIAAIAQHEHLPEIVALEMGACLCGTPEGRQRIRRMIIEDSEEACRRGETRTAARLGLVLHHFIETHVDRQGAAEPWHPASATTAPPWVRERVDTSLAAMLRHFGIDRASARERFGSELQIAQMCCVACPETERCRRFLAGTPGAEAPSAFCPNAPLLDELERSLRACHAE
jgi:hypothetical protein